MRSRMRLADAPRSRHATRWRVRGPRVATGSRAGVKALYGYPKAPNLDIAAQFS